MKVITQVGARLHHGTKQYWDEALRVNINASRLLEFSWEDKSWQNPIGAVKLWHLSRSFPRTIAVKSLNSSFRANRRGLRRSG